MLFNFFVLGTCQDKVNGYSCNCTTGFNGSVCEHNIDDCGSHTCSDYQDCQDGVNNYTCVCKPGKFVASLGMYTNSFFYYN